MAGRDEGIQQALVDTVGADFQRRLVTVLEDAFVEDLFGPVHIGPDVLRRHIHERTFELPAHDALVLRGEGLEQARGHVADDTGPHIPGPLPEPMSSSRCGSSFRLGARGSTTFRMSARVMMSSSRASSMSTMR